MTIDLNCDVGELADEALETALLDSITSANIACGGHAGDAATMLRTAHLALARGVQIGAHPGYPDPANFGRVELPLAAGETEAIILDQIARLESIVQAIGGKIVHVKPHGALYNLAARDTQAAHAIGRAVAHWNRSAVLIGLAGSLMLDVWREMGLAVWAEGFGDRRYDADGTLRSRRLPGALIEDPSEAAAQAVQMAQSGRVQTLCVHGDTPGAVEILCACRSALSRAGFSLRRT